MTDLFEIKLRIYSLFRAGNVGPMPSREEEAAGEKDEWYFVHNRSTRRSLARDLLSQNQKSIRQTIPLEDCLASEWVTV